MANPNEREDLENISAIMAELRADAKPLVQDLVRGINAFALLAAMSALMTEFTLILALVLLFLRYQTIYFESPYFGLILLAYPILGSWVTFKDLRRYNLFSRKYSRLIETSKRLGDQTLKGKEPSRVDDFLAQPSSLPLQHVRDLFDAIEEAGGAAKHWRLEGHLSFVGNTAALNRWLDNLIKGGYVEEVTVEDDSRGCKKTELGQTFHNALRDHRHLKIFNSVMRHYSGDRLRP